MAVEVWEDLVEVDVDSRTPQNGGSGILRRSNGRADRMVGWVDESTMTGLSRNSCLVADLLDQSLSSLGLDQGVDRIEAGEASLQ